MKLVCNHCLKRNKFYIISEVPFNNDLRERMSSDYSKVLQAFKALGYSQTTQLQEYETNKALDSISAKAGGPNQFDRDVAQELWQHTSKERGNTVMLREFIQTIIEAQQVLKDHIAKTEQQLTYQTNPADKEELQADLLSYVNDHKILTQPFRLNQITQSRTIIQSKANLAASSRMTAGNPGGAIDAIWARKSQIFATSPSQRQQSWSLKIVLILTIILFSVQIFIIFHKNHFFNLLVYTMIFLIFAQNYFDQLYMGVTIGSVALSILLDFIWLIFHAENWWNPYAETQHSTTQTGYLRFTYFLVICEMLAKILVAILMVRYLSNPETIRKSVTIFNLSFKLDGKSQNNPITQALRGNSSGESAVSPVEDNYQFA